MTWQAKRVPNAAWKAASSSFEPQLETSAAGWRAAAISARACSTAASSSTAAPRIIAAVARGRSNTAARSRPLLQIHGPLTAGFSRGVTRSMRAFAAGSSRFSFQAFLRCQMSTLQPRSQPGQIEGVGSRYQTRALCRNGRDSSAPTGQRSMTLSEYGSRSKAPFSTARTSEWSPRCWMPRPWDFEISRVKRTQREHRMQRSLSRTMRSESAWCLVARTLASRETEGSPL